MTDSVDVPLGSVTARLGLIDADGLAAWRHDESIDGLADVAFRGRSNYTAADHTGASLLPGEGGQVFGWRDLPVAEAVDRAIALRDWRAADPDRRLMIDFRPHSHHWQVMALGPSAEGRPPRRSFTPHPGEAFDEPGDAHAGADLRDENLLADHGDHC
ncbi:hypothetical protein [Actinomadura algeriensis]|uniref:Uncharacterized protein n=1 Tax=Actinomadura algeriensis TaxID=1679523 RepID=A0ABR9JM27_9ACTN|nr:hypothetical protein [Actinomadura algeriensis]MBE1531494.1 hypothetical protein [Actinomadura algeriensis]